MKLGFIREIGPYLVLACGVVLAIKGHPTEGLITGAFALIQSPHPTQGQ